VFLPAFLDCSMPTSASTLGKIQDICRKTRKVRSEVSATAPRWDRQDSSASDTHLGLGLLTNAQPKIDWAERSGCEFPMRDSSTVSSDRLMEEFLQRLAERLKVKCSRFFLLFCLRVSKVSLDRVFGIWNVSMMPRHMKVSSRFAQRCT
jgi:hypothetical protein